MKAVILAAGKSTRTYPLTANKPKPLLKAANKTLLEHNLEQLNGLIDEAIIIVGFGKEQIKKKFDNNFGKIKVRYAEQKEQLGTGNALLQAERFVGKERFVVLMGDDLYGKDDIKKGIKNKYSIFAKRVRNPKYFGVLETKGGFLIRLTEKPEKPTSDLVDTGLYVLDEKIFSLLKKIKESERKEYELTDAVTEFAGKEKVKVVEQSFWYPIAYPWSLLEANEALLGKIKKNIKGKIEKNATIRGEAVIGKGTIIKSGAYIEGPVVIGENCIIGPNCYIRPSTAIGNNCKIGNAVEVKNSILMDNVHIGHLSYVGDSVLADNVNFGAGTAIANLRHDNSEVKSVVNGKLISTGRRKFGAVIGENAKTGINTSIYPGRKIWPGKTTMPGEIVRKDVV